MRPRFASARHHAVERDARFDAPPAQLFALWAEGRVRPRCAHREGVPRLDFRTGGRERLAGRDGNGVGRALHLQYVEIVADRRLVIACERCRDQRRVGASLLTIEFLPDAGGTRVRAIEQALLLDPAESAQAVAHALHGLLDALALALEADGVAEPR